MVRKDLKPGAQLAQSCHAAFHFSQEHPQITAQWMQSSDYICILSAPNEQELLSLVEKAKRHDIRFSCFREADLDGQMTAVALAPGMLSKKICSNLPLALKE